MDVFGISVCGVFVLCLLLSVNFSKLSSRGVLKILPSSSLMPTYVGSRTC